MALGVDRMASGFLGATLFYIKENNKRFFKRVGHVLFPTDFIRKKLTSEKGYVTDITNAFGSGLLNVRLNDWHYKYINKLNLPINIFPQIKKPKICQGIRP